VFAARDLINFAVYLITLNLSLAAYAASATAFFFSAGIKLFDILNSITLILSFSWYVCKHSAN